MEWIAVTLAIGVVFVSEIINITIEYLASFVPPAYNMPDFMCDGFGEPKNGQMHTLDGRWNLECDKYSKRKEWQLKKHYNPGVLFEKGMVTWYNLYVTKDEEKVIWIFIGDLDMGKRLLFKRKK